MINLNGIWVETISFESSVRGLYGEKGEKVFQATGYYSLDVGVKRIQARISIFKSARTKSVMLYTLGDGDDHWYPFVSLGESEMSIENIDMANEYCRKRIPAVSQQDVKKLLNLATEILGRKYDINYDGRHGASKKAGRCCYCKLP